MARIRTIKPDFFRHEELQDLEIENPGAYCMMVYAGLWTQCDRNGVFLYKPRSLKLDILPFLPFDMQTTLNLLESAGFIRTFQSDGKRYGAIPSFTKHQRFSGKESGEEGVKYPEPSEFNQKPCCEVTGKQPGSNGEATGKQLESQERERSKGKGKDFTPPNPPRGETADQKTETLPAKQNSIPYDQIVCHLNMVTGKNFRTENKNTRKRIKALWARGFSLEDFISVIEKKSAKWRGDAKMADFLRPETLFGEKFESYLNESQKPAVQQFSDKTAQNLVNLQAWMEDKDREEQETVFGEHGIDGRAF